MHVGLVVLGDDTTVLRGVLGLTAHTGIPPGVDKFMVALLGVLDERGVRGSEL